MSKTKLLVVDDEEIVLIGMEKEIRSAGYDVRTAKSGKRAIELSREEKPDIVITDLVMPEMDGVEVCKNIKAMYPDTDVVFLSGHPRETEKNIMDFFKAGGKDMLLRKPILENELREAIEKVLKERK